MLVVFVGASVGLAVFIKMDTGVAAQLTDNYLRPILGPSIVIKMEKFYFNLADFLQQKLYSPKGDYSNGLETGDLTGVNIGGSGLELKDIPMVTNLPREKNEGVWKVRKLKAFPDSAVMAYSYVRPDEARPFAYVTLLQVDMHKVRIGAVAGTKQPGGPVGMIGPGKVPDEIIASGGLIAAFDGGFQYRDGQYGMIVGDTTYLPLQKDVASLVGYTDGRLKLVDYQGQDLGKGVAFVRQNCPMLVQDGKVAIYDEANKKLWGRTPTVAIYTWRSGLGIDKNGNLIFAVGNNLTPETLGIALAASGAVSAMQLDINPFWVRFNIFDTLGNGEYKTVPLIKDLRDGSKDYLTGYAKDFFYIYKP